jgi:tRNA A-37 threonylcarbamoyl transferase component Bud32
VREAVSHPAASPASLSSALPLFEPVLERLRAEAALHFGAPDLQLVPIASEDRPFSRLLRVGVCRDAAATPDRYLFVKLFKPKPHDGGVEKMRARVERDFQESRRIYDAMAAAADVGAVRPVACYPDHLAIVSEQAEGQTLMSHLEGHASWFPGEHTLFELRSTMESIGRWLRVFQAIEPGLGRVRLSDLHSYVDLRLERLVSHEIISPSSRQQILSWLNDIARQVTEPELDDVMIHADLAPGNILVSGARITVLDFAMVQRGGMLHDISRLYVQLDVLRAKPQFRTSVVRALQSALLRGFDETLTPDRPLFRYFVMLHRINHLGSLSLNRERFFASVHSRRVRRLHRTWIEHELEGIAAGRGEVRR